MNAYSIILIISAVIFIIIAVISAVNNFYITAIVLYALGSGCAVSGTVFHYLDNDIKELFNVRK